MALTVDGELIQDVQHLGRVELFTPKLEESLQFFREVLGLEACIRRAARSICAATAITRSARSS